MSDLGTERSFEQFADESTPVLFRTAWVLTGDRHLAEDLVQEALARVFVKWNGVARIESPVAYTRTTMMHLFLSGRRRMASREVVTDRLPDRGAEVEVDAAIALREALSRLPASDRAVLVLRHLCGLSVSEVAHDLGISEGAVRTRTHRAGRRLRAVLGEDFLVTT